LGPTSSFSKISGEDPRKLKGKLRGNFVPASRDLRAPTPSRLTGAIFHPASPTKSNPARHDSGEKMECKSPLESLVFSRFELSLLLAFRLCQDPILIPYRRPSSVAGAMGYFRSFFATTPQEKAARS
jgi:hypothetical protein